jgi:2-polyprenyl-3-methyl-5-hydroxy-6-metoxy-1,4-benzoquinol methylase
LGRGARREPGQLGGQVPLHVAAYATEALGDDPAHLSSEVRTDLEALAPYLPGGTVAGLQVCHLQCHIGTDTLSLAKAGASVVGIDFSTSALAAAATLAGRLGIDATWIETDVLEARAAVGVALGDSSTSSTPASGRSPG